MMRTRKKPLIITACEICLAALLGLGGSANAWSADSMKLDAPAILTNAAAVHRLSASLAAQQLPVRLDAVVTHFNSRLGDGFFVQDTTDGIYVKLGTNKVEVTEGDRLLLEGLTAPGDYAPVVLLKRWRKLGSAPLPPPEPVTASELASGRFDCRRVEVHGIVRSAAPALLVGKSHLAMQLRSGGEDLLVGINNYTPEATNLVDAEVIVRGVVGGIFSWQRQLLAPTLLLDTDASVQVIRQPQAPDTLPLVTIQSLFRYSPAGFPERRIRLQCRLIGRVAGKWLAVRDATSGLLVECADDQGLVPGDELDLAGFPELRNQTLWLVNTLVRKVGHGEVPAAIRSTVAEALRQPCELRRLEGTLVGPPQPGEGSWVLNLRDHDSEFEVWVPSTGGSYPAVWREGARLAIAGITEPFFLSSQRLTLYPFPRGLRLHVRTSGDVELLAAAPWWTSPHLARIVSYTLAGVLVLLALVTLAALALARKNAALHEARGRLRVAQEELARRFKARTGEWREELAARHAAEAEFALLTAERTRLARELHDTLEQTLASVALQLDAVKGFFQEQPQESERLLDAATLQLRESQAEVRRSVWNLRSVKLDEATLPEALEQLGKALTDTQGPAVEFEFQGTPEHIPPGVASHLFRVAQESVTNAIKHAGARNIRITLALTPAGLELVVADDGGGFDVSAAAGEGHFGLRGLRERAAALGGNLMLESTADQGTRVMLTVLRKQLEEN